MKTEALSDSFTGSWDPDPHTGLLCSALIHEGGGCLVLLQLAMPCFINTYVRPALS